MLLKLTDKIPNCWRWRRIDPVVEISLTRAGFSITNTFTGFVLAEDGLIARQNVGQLSIGVNTRYADSRHSCMLYG